MEILVLFMIVFFCAVGVFVANLLGEAARLAGHIGEQLQEEAKRFDQAVQQAMVELQKPQQSDEVIAQVRYRMEIRGK